ncbi:MAG: hypothetical protein RL264_3142 [Bacteroidota bacterium]
MNSKSSSMPYRLLIFLVLPIAAFAQSIRKIHIKEHFWIVLLFALFFSYTYIPLQGSDAMRYVDRFGSLNNYGFSQYLEDIKGMYDGSGFYQDAYVYTIQLVVSPFTSDIRVYRLVLGFVYFFTFLSLIKYLILNNLGQRTKFNWFILGIVFIISFTSGINGIRWPLAFMVFLLGAYRYITTSHKKYLFLASLSLLIHFIFFLSVLIFLLFVLTRKYYKPKITSLFVLVLFFFSNFFATQLTSNATVIGDGFEEKVVEYSENESWKEQRTEGFNSMNWYVQLQRTAPNTFVFFALIITTYFGLKLRKSDLVTSLQYLAFLSFFISFISAQLVDQNSNRFAIVATAVGLIYLYHLYNENPKNKVLNVLRKVYIPIAVLTILGNIRADLYTVSPNLVFGNVLTEMFYRFDESIQGLVGL